MSVLFRPRRTGDDPVCTASSSQHPLSLDREVSRSAVARRSRAARSQIDPGLWCTSKAEDRPEKGGAVARTVTCVVADFSAPPNHGNGFVRGAQGLKSPRAGNAGASRKPQTRGIRPSLGLAAPEVLVPLSGHSGRSSRPRRPRRLRGESSADRLSPENTVEPKEASGPTSTEPRVVTVTTSASQFPASVMEAIFAPKPESRC